MACGARDVGGGAVAAGTWLFAMDYLFLAFGQISAALLTYKCQNTMPRWWGHLGMVAGVIGLLNFLVELGRLGSYVACYMGCMAGHAGSCGGPCWLVVPGGCVCPKSASCCRRSMALS